MGADARRGIFQGGQVSVADIPGANARTYYTIQPRFSNPTATVYRTTHVYVTSLPWQLCRSWNCSEEKDCSLIFSCVAYMRKQVIGYSVGVLLLLLLLLLLLGKYSLLTLMTNNNSTMVRPTPRLAMSI